MAIYTGNFELNSGTAIMIVPPKNMSQHVLVHNHDHGGSDDVYIGSHTLTTALNGMHVPDAETVNLILHPGDALYAISDSGTPEVHVFSSTL